MTVRRACLAALAAVGAILAAGAGCRDDEGEEGRGANGPATMSGEVLNAAAPVTVEVLEVTPDRENMVSVRARVTNVGRKVVKSAEATCTVYDSARAPLGSIRGEIIQAKAGLAPKASVSCHWLVPLERWGDIGSAGFKVETVKME